MLLRWRRGRWK